VLQAAHEAARRTASPDRDLYVQAKQRTGAQRATLTTARKIARGAHHSSWQPNPQPDPTRDRPARSDGHTLGRTPGCDWQPPGCPQRNEPSKQHSRSELLRRTRARRQRAGPPRSTRPTASRTASTANLNPFPDAPFDICGNQSHAVAATLRQAPDQAKSPGVHAMSDEPSACPGLSSVASSGTLCRQFV
jgi:hypothetical protein